MEKQQERLPPFSSDEFPNSGEDSEEDEVIDYSDNSIMNENSMNLNIQGTTDTDIKYTKDNSVLVMSETMNDKHALIPDSNIHNQPHHPLVPIISVTPHSPGVVSKYYPVLEENLQHLHEIYDSVQRIRMQDPVLGSLGYNNRFLHDEQIQRLSWSCPSLQNLMSLDPAARLQHQDCGSEPDLLTNCSNNSSPTYFSGSGPNNAQINQCIDRRRSWTDLETTKQSYRRRSAQNFLQAQNMKQRSISLNSLDGEIDLVLGAKPRKQSTCDKERPSRSPASTHSLNEADFIQSGFSKRTSKGENQELPDRISLIPGVVGSRLTLQKSVSTPSIVTPPGPIHPTDSGTLTASSINTESHGDGAVFDVRKEFLCTKPNLFLRRSSATIERNRHERHEKGSGSETETEDLHIPRRHESHEDLIGGGVRNVQTSLDELSTDGTAYDDQHSEKTRRKRGSLFFRKKKDKNVKKSTLQHNHQWMTLIAGSQANTVCDSCMKLLSSKFILQCENCGSMVHQNQTCKDQLQLDCIKSKHQPGKGVTKSLSSVSSITNNNITKRVSTVSLPLSSSIGSGSKKAVSSYSPWRRVATKLGVNQTINEEKDGDNAAHRDSSSAYEEFDFGDDAHQFSADSLEDFDPELGLGKEEPDSWSAAVGRHITLRQSGNSEREVKRQEHLYEFVLTEKHHCLVLLAMDKIFVDGLRHHFQMTTPAIDRMFPRLRDLIDIHIRFLMKLRRRQNINVVVSTIADILIEQFSGENAVRMKNAYGDFCSRHRDAVEAYKYYLREDTRFARFVRHCQTNPLLKKKGIPECILFVTQRLTKYPLLVEPLIKTGVSQEEVDNLKKALSLVKEILADVDACVANKEREDRKLEIYNRIDAKSYAVYREHKFKKSDILSSNRNLKFEGTSYLMQGRGKMAQVVVVVLSDVLFFLAETRDQKYAFFVPDNKAGVVSLQRLLVREKAGQDSRGIYLISSNPSEPEMFELKVQKPKDKQVWIQAIRAAVETCPQDQDNRTDILVENYNCNEMKIVRSSSISLLPFEERRFTKNVESDIKKIIDELRKKDTEQALLLEEKMGLQMQLLHTTNVYSGNNFDGSKMEKYKEIPDYTRFVRNEEVNSIHLWKEVVIAVQEATRLASSLSFAAGGATLSRSLSSAGERHSEAYVPPSLCVPRRAETFAGFDHNKDRSPWRDTATLQSVLMPSKENELLPKKVDIKGTDETEGNKVQQEIAVQLSHYVYTLLCIISNQMTTIESLHAQLAAYGGVNKPSNSRPNPNRQLEELRNLQDQLSQEKSMFRTATQQEKRMLDEERAELTRLRAQLVDEQRDVTQQRDQLYRRLEALERQGVSLVTPSAAGSAPVHVSHPIQGDQVQCRKPSQTDDRRIPLNLVSATNQTKVQKSLPPVKQQLPLKLASGSNNNNTR